MKKYICLICGFVYDEAIGIPSSGIAPGTTWEQLPDNWICPVCGATKSEFRPVVEDTIAKPVLKNIKVTHDFNDQEMTEMSPALISALCTNLAKGCEKQYLKEEQSLFIELASYYEGLVEQRQNANYQELIHLINSELANEYPSSNDAASLSSDRGAKRALTWSEKVTRILSSILKQYEQNKELITEHTGIYVCEICGFIYIGNDPPVICPVCKVPNKKITKIERGQ